MNVHTYVSEQGLKLIVSVGHDKKINKTDTEKAQILSRSVVPLSASLGKMNYKAV